MLDQVSPLFSSPMESLHCAPCCIGFAADVTSVAAWTLHHIVPLSHPEFAVEASIRVHCSGASDRCSADEERLTRHCSVIKATQCCSSDGFYI